MGPIGHSSQSGLNADLVDLATTTIAYQFRNLDIEHLRSPASVHTDPSSTYALEIFAANASRMLEIHEMRVREFHCFVLK